MTRSVKKKSKPCDIPKSLKYRGIIASTRKRYMAQQKVFWRYLDMLNISIPDNWPDFDDILADYIDDMFQNGDPVGYAGDLL